MSLENKNAVTTTRTRIGQRIGGQCLLPRMEI